MSGFPTSAGIVAKNRRAEGVHQGVPPPESSDHQLLARFARGGDLDAFQAEDAERLSASLGKDDSDNVMRIAARLMELQTEAAGAPTQLAITLPVRGRRLVFTRPLQVDPAAEMTVRISAHERPAQPATWPWTVGLAALLVGLGMIGQRLVRPVVVPAPAVKDPWEGVARP